MSLVKETSSYFLFQVISFLLGFSSDIVISRNLGATGRGDYYLVFTTYVMTAGIFVLGMSYACTYMLAKKKAPITEVHSVTLIYVAAISLIIAVILWSLCAFSHNNIILKIRPRLSIIVIMVPIDLYRQCWYGIMIGLNRVIEMGKTVAAISGINFLSLVIFMNVLRWELKGAFIVMIISGLISLTIMMGSVFKRTKIISRPDGNLLKEMLTFGGTAHIGNAAVQIYQKIGIYFLTLMRGMADVGYYTLSQTIAEKQLMVLNALNVSANYRVIGGEKKTSEKLMATLIRYSIVILGIVCLMALISSRFIVRLLYGNAFTSAIPLLMILLPGTIFLGLASMISNYFSGQLGRPLITSGLSMGMLVISLPIYYLFTKNMGMNGTSIAISIVYIFHFIVLLVIFNRMASMPIKESLVINRRDVILLKEKINNITTKAKRLIR